MSERNPHTPERRWLALAFAAAAVGLTLMADSLRRSSATYDEVAYLRVSCRWWRTGDQESITRMGSPLTFWKLQQAPTLWLLDRAGHGDWIDDPEAHQAEMLPPLRLGSLWIWATALGLTAAWAKRLHGPRAMAFAAWMFALSPNLLAHGALITMEMPLVATSAGVGLLFSAFLGRAATGPFGRLAPDPWFRDRAFWAAAILSGLAFSCKFTAVLIPPLCGFCWLVARLARGERPVAGIVRITTGMFAFLIAMTASDLILTGFATLPISETVGSHPSLGPSPGWVGTLLEIPIPQDWVGFLTQIRHQRSGGPSYLLGERRMTGWWYYYFVAMSVNVPISFWILVLARCGIGRRRDGLLPLAMAAFLLITAAGSSRNYGFRYLLPIAPLAIVWISALAESGRAARLCAIAGLMGQAVAVASIHPHELSYFNAAAGGPVGGRRLLADSNLDWGQGLRGLARLQRESPEFRDLTLYYFGDTRPSHYGVVGRAFTIDAGDRHPELPPQFEADSRYVAVSSSLQFGPWGPPGYFEKLKGVKPARILDDATIAIYAADDLKK